MIEDGSVSPTPREYDYWKLAYRELAILPEWSELGGEARAQRLLEKIEEKLAEADAPPQRKTLFQCSEGERLKTVKRMIDYFEEEDKAV